MFFQPLLGEFGKIPVLIRDDDTNFFTRPNMLESIYSIAWEKGLKTSFAVVPMQIGTNNISVPPENRTSESVFPISDNKKLTQYLTPKIRDGTVEILQHGLYHFIDKKGHWEFGQNLNKKRDIERGRNLLKRAFETDPKFFVPPGEVITKSNVQTVIDSGLVPICRRTAFDNFLANPIVPSYIKQAASKFVASKYKDTYKTEKNVIQFLKPVNVKITENFISWTTPLVSSRITSPESLFDFTDEVIRDSYSQRLPICILNHYHVFYYDWNSTITRNEVFRCWTQLVEKFNKLQSVWFTTFSELYGRSMLIKNIQIAETGSKITIESKVNIKNLSIRTTRLLEPNDSVIFDKETKISTIEELIPNRKIILYEKN
jgi:Uncharacterized protein conserved in bacteria (DUF2334)